LSAGLDLFVRIRTYRERHLGSIPNYGQTMGSATQIMTCRAQNANPDRSASRGRPLSRGLPNEIERSGIGGVTTGLTTALAGFGRSRWCAARSKTYAASTDAGQRGPGLVLTTL
jgi:hypothetical protein